MTVYFDKENNLKRSPDDDKKNKRKIRKVFYLDEYQNMQQFNCITHNFKTPRYNSLNGLSV